jgi:hypothetical protein
MVVHPWLMELHSPFALVARPVRQGPGASRPPGTSAGECSAHATAQGSGGPSDGRGFSPQCVGSPRRSHVPAAASFPAYNASISAFCACALASLYPATGQERPVTGSRCHLCPVVASSSARSRRITGPHSGRVAARSCPATATAVTRNTLQKTSDLSATAHRRALPCAVIGGAAVSLGRCSAGCCGGASRNFLIF